MQTSWRWVVRRRWLLALIALAGLWHAQWYDFFCDDAFIALRYAKNLSQHHELSYNLGQRVEGFTSPLWVLLIAAAGLLGVPLVAATHVLGGVAALFALWATSRFWDELEPEAPWLSLIPAAALATSAPFAAWTFGGLETPLFVAFFTLGLAEIARAVRVGDVPSALRAGLAVALGTTCRPEAATLIALGSVAMGLPPPTRSAPRWQRYTAWLAPIACLAGGYELFRLAYYGDPLPNTFYVKTSGEALWQRGLSYLTFAAAEFGWTLVLACSISLAYLVLQRQRAPAGNGTRSDRVLVVCTSFAVAIHLSYVARVGGDFLDLYRFLAVLLPAAFCCLTSAARRLFAELEAAARVALLAAAACLAVVHGWNQYALAGRATRVAESSRAALHLEPLGWTRLYARRWQGLGSWLAKVRTAGDSTAVGAAGALPYYSELPNLDLFGLNDLEIARNGRIIGNRPGHQRFATMEYLFEQKPTFIFMNPESTPKASGRLRYDRYWTSHGYLPIEVRVDRELCACAEPFYHQFWVRSERAESLRGRNDAVVGSVMR